MSEVGKDLCGLCLTEPKSIPGYVLENKLVEGMVALEMCEERILTFEFFGNWNWNWNFFDINNAYPTLRYDAPEIFVLRAGLEGGPLGIGLFGGDGREEV